MNYRQMRKAEHAMLDTLAAELPEVPLWHAGAHALLDEIVALAETPTGRFPVVRRGERDPIPLLTRRLVLRRDNHHCAGCDYTGKDFLQLDHVLPWSSGGSDRSDNLRTLCEWCNNERSNFLEAGLPRTIGVTAVCDPCLLAHDGQTTVLHDRSGLWFECPRCREWGGEWQGTERIPAYCGTCDSTSWISDGSRIL